MIVVVLFVLFFLGMPIAFSIITTVAGYLIVTDARPLILVAQRCYAGLDSVACLAVPLFTLAGYLMEKGGISKRLVDWVGMLLGGIRGSLGIVAVVTCTIFAALTGSGPATVCAIGGILYLPMVQSGYPRKNGKRPDRRRRLSGPHHPAQHRHDRVCQHNGHQHH